jgi:hypothetical protein
MLYAGRALPAAYLRAYRRDVGYVIKQDDKDPAILHLARPGHDCMPPPPTAHLLCNCILTIGVSHRKVQKASMTRVQFDRKFSSPILPGTPYLITPPRDYRLDKGLEGGARSAVRGGSDVEMTAAVASGVQAPKRAFQWLTPAPSGQGIAPTPMPLHLARGFITRHLSCDSAVSAADTPASHSSLVSRPFKGSKGLPKAPKRAFQWLGNSLGAARKAPSRSVRALVVEWEKPEG